MKLSKLKNTPFWAPVFNTSRTSAILWLSVLLMLLLKMYEGDRLFFEKHFQNITDNEQVFLWLMWLWHHSGTFVFFFLIPVILIRFVIKDKLKNYGLTVGDYKFGLKATAAALIIMPFVVYQSAQNPDHAAFYNDNFPLELANSSAAFFGLWALTYLPHYLGWEFFFRGYIGLGFKKDIGLFAAGMLQIILTVLMHIGKPQGETWGTVFGGIYLGLLTIRTGSVWYAVLFHLYIGLLNSYFCFN